MEWMVLLSVGLLFVVPLLVVVAAAGMILESALGRPQATGSDAARTMVAIVGIAVAAAAAFVVTALQGFGENGPGFNWSVELQILLGLAVIEAAWVVVVCRP